MSFNADPSLCCHAGAGCCTGEVGPTSRGVDQRFRSIAAARRNHGEWAVAFHNLYYALLAGLDSALAARVPKDCIQIKTGDARRRWSDFGIEDCAIGKDSPACNSWRIGDQLPLRWY